MHQGFEATFNAFGDYESATVSVSGCSNFVGNAQFSFDGTFFLRPPSGPVVTGTATGPLFSGTRLNDFDLTLTPIVGSPILMAGTATPTVANQSVIRGFLTQL